MLESIMGQIGTVRLYSVQGAVMPGAVMSVGSDGLLVDAGSAASG